MRQKRNPDRLFWFGLWGVASSAQCKRNACEGDGVLDRLERQRRASLNIFQFGLVFFGGIRPSPVENGTEQESSARHYFAQASFTPLRVRRSALPQRQAQKLPKSNDQVARPKKALLGGSPDSIPPFRIDGKLGRLRAKQRRSSWPRRPRWAPIALPEPKRPPLIHQPCTSWGAASALGKALVSES